MSTKDKRGKKPQNFTSSQRQIYIDQLIEEIEARGLTPSTLRGYLTSIHKFLDFYPDQNPENLGLPEIKKFQRNLLKEKDAAPNTVNRHLSGVKFFYMNVLGRHEFGHLLPRVKTPRNIPIVLSENEVARMIDVVHSALWRAVILTTYSAGLRQSEVRNLEIKDVDSNRMVLQIRNAKGQKSRQALLSPVTLKALRTYWKIHRLNNDFKSEFLFTPTKNSHSGKKAKKLSHTAIGYMVRRAAELAGVKKKLIHIFCATPLQLIF